MTAGVEIELKLRVASRADLDAIARAADATERGAVRQVNHFFDTTARWLRVAKLGVRLREEAPVDDSTPPRFIFTVKGRNRGDGARAVRDEDEREVAPDVARGVLDGTRPVTSLLDESAPLTARVREAAGDAPVARVGAFENIRRRAGATLEVAGAPLAVTLELDETTFPNGAVHHEVEVELPGSVDGDAALAALRALLARAGVTGAPAPGKASRFFAALAGAPLDGARLSAD